jgi:hypothetical protein
MSKNKSDKTVSITESSAAQYLTFVAAVGSDLQNIEMRYQDENIWLTQKMMATLYDVTVPAINQHLKRIFDDAELSREATVKQYLIVQTEGNRAVTREVEHYNLQAIISNEILTGPGKISHEQAKLHAETEFEKYRIVQDRLFESDFDRFVALQSKRSEIEAEEGKP